MLRDRLAVVLVLVGDSPVQLLLVPAMPCAAGSEDNNNTTYAHAVFRAGSSTARRHRQDELLQQLVPASLEGLLAGWQAGLPICHGGMPPCAGPLSRRQNSWAREPRLRGLKSASGDDETEPDCWIFWRWAVGGYEGTPFPGISQWQKLAAEAEQ
ncbi:hypothetical protein K402DRAFT_127545 [Aulographum hederae CBS 113979]|uniref:Uncharacterized protein n=1 Tax=Aulographum hederae CBS 113979 TaxID=1176131 RepID=A0A6G1HE70_9PEZI|nr:hypothetical protein K402DRAFT_127545 [Aulographum hederae CBS 113979]